MEVVMTPELAKRMLGRAVFKLVENRAEINRYNEFPVPDGDTGNNMLLTLAGVVNEIQGKDYGQDYRGFLDDARKILLESISGNAGTISAGFLSGFFEGLINGNRAVDGETLCRGMKLGRDEAIRSVRNPKNGTMLDVICVAEERARSESASSDVEEIFNKALESARQDLPKTSRRMLRNIESRISNNPNLQENNDLEIMRNRIESLVQAGVGDAGAMGFVFMLEGLCEGMFNEEDAILPENIFSDIAIPEVSDIGEDVDLKNPYEIQFILESEADDNGFEKFLASLGRLGDSLDTFGLSDINSTRVHIHTSQVEEVQRLSEEVGDARNIKVVDMRKEIIARNGKKHNLMIVTDGGADLPWNILAKGIFVVPFKLNFPEQYDLSGDFYQQALEAKEWPTTSQPSVGVFLKSIRNALALAQEVLVVTISSKLSGSYNSALQAKELLDADESRRVHIVDSKSAACGQALVVHKALLLTEQSESMDDIMLGIGHVRENCNLFGYPKDIDYLIKGGRLKRGTAKARLAKFLQKIGIYPKLSLRNGVIESRGISRFGRLDENLYEEFVKSKSGLVGLQNQRIYCAISYAKMGREARSLARRISGNKNVEVLFVEKLSRVIGVHTGPALLASWYTENV